MRIIGVVGARPNFVKMAPLYWTFQKFEAVQFDIVHTGQHYDDKMSKIFFEQLELPKPKYHLGVGSGSHSEVIANVIIGFEKVLLVENPSLIIVVGDVNSTLACALVANKLNIPLAHVESGLRSGDRTMPEEINRILTDSISDYLFTTEKDAIYNLSSEGISLEKIFFVGNSMIDSLIKFRKKANSLNLLENLELTPKNFILMTFHRPSNVDNKRRLLKIVSLIQEISNYQKIVIPIHPRTLKNLKLHNLFSYLNELDGVMILPPQGYVEFIQLMDKSAMIITDSGGIQEEATYLKVPCITLRNSTERPCTTLIGSNTLIPDGEFDKVLTKFFELLENKIHKNFQIPELWDGKTSERIADILYTKLKSADS